MGSEKTGRLCVHPIGRCHATELLLASWSVKLTILRTLRVFSVGRFEMIAAYCSSMVAPGKVLTLSLVVMTAFTAATRRADASGSVVATVDARRARVKNTP